MMLAIWNANLNYNLALFVCTLLNGTVNCKDYTALMTEECVSVEHWWTTLTWKNRSTQETPVPAPFCPPQILCGLAWD